MQQLINDILHDMSEVLSAKDLYALQIVLQKKLNTQNNQTYPYTNIEYMDMLFQLKELKVVQNELWIIIKLLLNICLV